MRELCVLHPATVDLCPLDAAYFTLFGPADLERCVRRRGLEPQFLDRCRELLAFLERHSTEHSYDLLGRPTDAEERTVSWIPLRIADFELREAGVDGALAILEPRASALDRTESWVNRQLAAETHLTLARVHRYAGDAAAARSAAERALALAGELRQSLRLFVVSETADDRLTLPPIEQFLHRDGDYGAILESRAHAALANLYATFDANAPAASRHAFRSGRARVFDDWHWMAAALDHARRGRIALARRCLGCLEPARDQLYDLACVLAWSGEVDSAISQLHAHLDERCPTPTSRALEIRTMRRDADLRTLHDHADFPRE